MITNKYINFIIVGFLLLAVGFTGIMMYRPEVIGAVAANWQPEYTSKIFNKDNIISIDIKADESEWSNMLENATKEEYITCDVTINGTTFTSVGIRPKGNSSLSMVAGSDSDRYSFKFEFDHYIKGQTCFGLDKFVINNIQSDFTYMKEYMSYELMAYMGVSTPLYAYADVKVNGKDWGFYLAVEALEESFAQRNFGSDYGMLYKPESMGMRGNGRMNDFLNQNQEQKKPEETAQPAEGPQNNSGQEMKREGRGGFGGFGGSSGGTDLKYADDNIDSYPNIFNCAVFKGTEADYKRVITALKNLSSGTELEKYIDVEGVLKYIAVNTFVVNLDSYFSNMTHNYYLYEENGKLSMLPWDYNLSFAGFQSGNASSAINFPIDTPLSGVEMSERPMVAKLLEVEEYKEKYHQYLQELADGFVNSGRYQSTIEGLNSLISEYVKNDVSAFCTYQQYSQAIPVLVEFGKLRAQSIIGQLEGSIPSTTEGQNNAQDKLLDASSINLSTLGSQGGGRGGGMNFNFNEGNRTQPSEGQQKSDTVPPGNFGQNNAGQGQSGQQRRERQGGMQPPGDMPQDGTQSGGLSQGDMPQGWGMMPENMPDMELMMQAMQIIQTADGKELTGEQLEKLKELGLTDEQITAVQNMSSRFANGDGMMPGGFQGGGFGDRQSSPGLPDGRGTSASSVGSALDLPVLILSMVFIMAGLVFVIKYRRIRYSVRR